MFTKRVAIDVGHACNADCIFCYYQTAKQGMLSGGRLRHRLRLARSLGMQSVEFTGGEPLLRTDICELISYARQLGFRRIGLITNGILLSSGVARDLKAAGLEEVKVSIHGPDKQTHEAVVRVTGSFDKLMDGITAARGAGLILKTNTVINKRNHRTLPRLAHLLVNIKPSRVNLKFTTPILQAQALGTDVIVRYSEASPYVRDALEILSSAGIDATVRYVPVCALPGYEKHICNLKEVQNDPDEWDYVVKNRLEYGWLLGILGQAVCYVRAPRQRQGGIDVSHHAVIGSKLVRYTEKIASCQGCRHQPRCDGLWKRYVSLYGIREAKPVTKPSTRA